MILDPETLSTVILLGSFMIMILLRSMPVCVATAIVIASVLSILKGFINRIAVGIIRWRQDALIFLLIVGSFIGDGLICLEVETFHCVAILLFLFVPLTHCFGHWRLRNFICADKIRSDDDYQFAFIAGAGRVLEKFADNRNVAE